MHVIFVICHVQPKGKRESTRQQAPVVLPTKDRKQNLTFFIKVNRVFPLNP